jgi:hypothetical protein
MQGSSCCGQLWVQMERVSVTTTCRRIVVQPFLDPTLGKVAPNTQARPRSDHHAELDITRILMRTCSRPRAHGIAHDVFVYQMGSLTVHCDREIRISGPRAVLALAHLMSRAHGSQVRRPS